MKGGKMEEGERKLIILERRKEGRRGGNRREGRGNEGIIRGRERGRKRM